MKAVKQLKELKKEEMDKRLSELKLELLKEQGNVRMGRPVKNPGKIKQIKRAIARILTIRQERKKEGLKK